MNLSVPSRGWTLTEEEGDVVNTTGTAVTTMIDEYIINYITGADTTSLRTSRTTWFPLATKT